VKSGYAPTDPTKEVLIPVADEKGNDAGAIKLNKSWVQTTTGSEDPQVQAKALNTPQNNNLMTWQNAVLGLDGTKSESKPVPAPQQTADASHIDFKLGGCNVAADSGATVKFKVYSADTPDAQSWTAASAETAYNGTATVELPSSGVRYYKFDVITETSK